MVKLAVREIAALDLCRHRQPERRSWALAAVPCFVALAMIGGLFGLQYQARAFSDEAERLRLSQPKAPEQVQAAAVAYAAPPYVASAKEMLDQHASRWETLLDALEGASVDGVKVSGIDYVATPRLARVSIVVAPADAFSPMQYVERLGSAFEEQSYRGLPPWVWSLARTEKRSESSSVRAEVIGSPGTDSVR